MKKKLTMNQQTINNIPFKFFETFNDNICSKLFWDTFNNSINLMIMWGIKKIKFFSILTYNNTI